METTCDLRCLACTMHVQQVEGELTRTVASLEIVASSTDHLIVYDNYEVLYACNGERVFAKLQVFADVGCGVMIEQC